MAGINHLKEVYEKKGEEFLKSLLNHYIIINEKVDGTFFGIKKSKDDTFRYFKKSGEINYVDRVLMKYYNSAISHFESMSLEKRQRIPANFYFGFEYFTNGDSLSSKYDYLPKNSLVLSYIHRLEDEGKVISTVQNKEQLDKWADYLGVERSPIIFEGHLTDEQKSAILEFVYSSNEDLFKKFKTTSFTKYIISILDVEKDASFLKKNLDGSIETIVFRFYDETEENPEEKVFLAKLVDPIFQHTSTNQSNQSENKSRDYIWLIVIDLMNHFEMYSLDELRKISGDGSFEERYVQLINSIFKDFVKEYEGKYEGLMLEVPEYLKRPEFELDATLIKDPEVERIIKSGSTYSEIYKILLNFFRRTRKRSSSGFFTSDLLTQLNIIVTKIKNVIMGDEIYESLFPSFSEFIGAANEEHLLNEKEAAERVKNKVEPIEVNLLIGNFQPLNMGHIIAAQKLKDKNGNKSILIAIKTDNKTKFSPFSLKQTKLILEKVAREYPELIEGIKIISSNHLEEVIDSLTPEYKPTLWGTSEKRSKDYLLQMDYIKKKNIPLRLDGEFKLVQLPVFVKSDDVLNAIKTSNFSEFKKLVPNSIASDFFNLQKELENKVNESATKSADFRQLFEKQIIAEIVDPKLKEQDANEGDV